MKYALCGHLIGLSAEHAQEVETKIDRIPLVRLWPQDFYFSEFVSEEGASVAAFRVPFYQKAVRDAFVWQWLRWYWDTEIITDPETGEEIEVRVRKATVQQAIKDIWEACEPGSRIWIEEHDHDELVRRGCKIEDRVEK